MSGRPWSEYGGDDDKTSCEYGDDDAWEDGVCKESMGVGVVSLARLSRVQAIDTEGVAGRSAVRRTSRSSWLEKM